MFSCVVCVVSLKSHIRLSFSGLKCKRVRLVGVIKPVNIFYTVQGISAEADLNGSPACTHWLSGHILFEYGG